jgi:hypothetical protein
MSRSPELVPIRAVSPARMGTPSKHRASQPYHFTPMNGAPSFKGKLH